MIHLHDGRLEKKRWTLHSADASITALFLTRSDDYSPSMMHRMVTSQNLVFQEVLSPTGSTLIKVWFIFVLVLLKAATQTVWTDFRVVDDYWFLCFLVVCFFCALCARWYTRSTLQLNQYPLSKKKEVCVAVRWSSRLEILKADSRCGAASFPGEPLKPSSPQR